MTQNSGSAGSSPLAALAVHGGRATTNVIATTLGRTAQELSWIRQDLIREGDIYAPQRGQVTLVVPIFAPCILAHYEQGRTTADTQLFSLTDLLRRGRSRSYPADYPGATPNEEPRCGGRVRNHGYDFGAVVMPASAEPIVTAGDLQRLLAARLERCTHHRHVFSCCSPQLVGFSVVPGQVDRLRARLVVRVESDQVPFVDPGLSSSTISGTV